MSGHSKWNNIKHKKEKTDAQRGKIFTKIGREITVCVKEGGGDPTINSKLRDLIAKAKTLNVPNDNIERVIKKASSVGEGDNYEGITYEGYGPSGVAVIVETLTDNRNRTAGSLRHYFDKYGGNLGQSGSVSWQFQKKGVIVVDAEDVDEDALMELGMDKGAEDVVNEGEAFELTCDPDSFSDLYEAVTQAGYTCLSAEIAMVPDNYISIDSEEGCQNMRKLLDMLEDDDDVQSAWHNWENEIE